MDKPPESPIRTPAGPLPGLTPADVAYLARAFTYHPPVGNQVDRYALIRAQTHRLAETILLTCPPTRERASALTRLEEAMMWANASIARYEPVEGMDPRD